MHASSNYTTDTSPEAEAVQLELIRQMSPRERVHQAMRLSQQVKEMAMNAIRRRHPEFDDNEVRLKFIALTYGTNLAEEVRDRLKGREYE